MDLFFLFVIPMLLVVFHQVYRVFYKETWRHELYIIPFVASAIVVAAGYGLSFMSEVYDYEIRNGVVLSKQQMQVSCSHDYDCNCKMVQSCTGSGAQRSCSSSRKCDTCYEHNHDYNWTVTTSIPNEYTISRVDRQGLNAPSRWASIAVNDPVSDSFMHVNYIKAAKSSLFNKELANPALVESVPAYPLEVYDYYKVNRVIGVGMPVNSEWHGKLQRALGVLGPKYQINAIVIFTTLGSDFDQALESKWLGGKKNDAVMVFHVDSATDMNVQSVYVMSWTDNNMFKVELRDSLEDLGKFDFDKVLGVFSEQVAKNWQRKHMKEFSYLKNDVNISPEIMGLIMLLSVLAYFGAFTFTKRQSRYF